MKPAELKKEISILEGQLVDLHHELNAKPELRTVQCLGRNGGGGCKKRTRIASLTYIQTHWYTPPSGCTGGDYWNDGEGQFVCPKCGELNRLYNRPDVEGMSGAFKEINKTYDD